MLKNSLHFVLYAGLSKRKDDPMTNTILPTATVLQQGTDIEDLDISEDEACEYDPIAAYTH